MTQDEIYELADIFIEKHGLQRMRWEGGWGYEDMDAAFRDVVANIILDTELTLDGTITMEQWREPA